MKYYKLFYSDVDIVILKSDKFPNGAALQISGRYYPNGNFGAHSSFTEDVTTEEIQWLEACIKAGKYVNKPKEQHYEIY